VSANYGKKDYFLLALKKLLKLGELTEMKDQAQIIFKNLQIVNSTELMQITKTP
jgi:hypothetical protein